MTLIDYPGKIAATVFTVGCNFRCPFCHNPELVLSNWMGGRGSVSEEEFFDFLEKRQGKLNGICITGGEPTIQKDIVEFIEKIKSLGYAVKLDSNGTRPDVLKKVIDKKIVDYIAMDIKNSLENYEKACGTKVDQDRIDLSVGLIRNSGTHYEFRTTVVPGIHEYSDFEKIGKWLEGSRRYVLQEYREGKILDESLKKMTKGKKLDLEKIKGIMGKYLDKVDVR